MLSNVREAPNEARSTRDGPSGDGVVSEGSGRKERGFACGKVMRARRAGPPRSTKSCERERGKLRARQSYARTKGRGLRARRHYARAKKLKARARKTLHARTERRPACLARSSFPFVFGRMATKKKSRRPASKTAAKKTKRAVAPASAADAQQGSQDAYDAFLPDAKALAAADEALRTTAPLVYQTVLASTNDVLAHARRISPRTSRTRISPCSRRCLRSRSPSSTRRSRSSAAAPTRRCSQT